MKAWELKRKLEDVPDMADVRVVFYHDGDSDYCLSGHVVLETPSRTDMHVTISNKR